LKVDLCGIRALVTGASRGIGRAVARRLALSGARVGVHYKSHEAEALSLCQEIGEAASPLRADLADPKACRTLFDDAIETLGGLEVLVNNAGVAIPAPFDQDDERWLSAWRATLAVNASATAILSRHAVRHFARRGGGRIVTLTSRAAFRGDTPDYLAYAASKGAQAALTRTIARGFGKQGVKAFLVAPGFTRTAMAQQFIDAYGEAHAISDIALERMTEPDDIAPLVAFLASGLADHATGGTFDVNAGSYVH